MLVILILISISLASCNPGPAISNGGQRELSVEVSVAEAHQLYQEGTLFVDVRTQEEWDAFHAPNSIHIPLDQLENRYAELPTDEEIVVVCRSGNRSQTGRDILLDKGFDQVTSMSGGLKAWGEAGYPLE
jgi:rhodanese-related sulfurtransferase